jgi:hypothetical protein
VGVLASCWPNPDRDAHADAVRLSAAAYQRALALIDPSAVGAVAGFVR